MSILVNKDTKVVVQGIPGSQGRFHTEQMLAYGTQVVAGVTPGKSGQEVCGVPVFESALTFTYRNNALSRVDGTYYPAGEIVRVSQSACISCADALVALLSSRDQLGWVGSEIVSCEQGYVHSETASSALRFVPVWRIETDAGSFYVNGVTREVRQLAS